MLIIFVPMFKYLIFAVLFVWGCNETQPGGVQKTKIVCTTGMITDAVSRMVGDDCEVKGLMGPGTDPHLFKPTKESLDLLGDADIIVANGLHLEGRMQDILKKLARKKTVLFVGDYLDTDHLIQGDDGSHFPDPHIWFDVAYWKSALSGIADQLGKEGVLNHDGSTSYLASLDTLDAWAGHEIGTIPKDKRVLITAHDAFSYFGRAYHIEVIGLQGISTAAEYGIRDVTDMVDLIAKRGIKAVFAESSISSRSIEAVVAGCAKRGKEVQLGGTLYSDAPGPADSGAGTYAGMVAHNVNTIKEALQ